MQKELRRHYYFRNMVLYITWGLILSALLFHRGSLVAAGLVICNLYAYAIMYKDKMAAKAHRIRIPESSLLLVSVLGGGFGAGLAMMSIRHKTKHFSFLAVIPASIVIYIGILIGMWLRFF